MKKAILPGSVFHEDSFSFQLHEQLTSTQVFQYQVKLSTGLECIDEVDDERMLLNTKPLSINTTAKIPISIKILHICWTYFVSNKVVRSHTGQPLLSDTIRWWRLSFFGHLRCADTSQDHSRALQACIRGPPKDWRCKTGRRRQTSFLERLRTICTRLISAWQWQGGTVWTDRHGVNSQRRPRLSERERD